MSTGTPRPQATSTPLRFRRNAGRLTAGQVNALRDAFRARPGHRRRPRLRLSRGHPRAAAADRLRQRARHRVLPALAPRVPVLLRAGAARPGARRDAAVVGLAHQPAGRRACRSRTPQDRRRQAQPAASAADPAAGAAAGRQRRSRPHRPRAGRPGAPPLPSVDEVERVLRARRLRRLQRPARAAPQPRPRLGRRAHGPDRRTQPSTRSSGRTTA